MSDCARAFVVHLGKVYWRRVTHLSSIGTAIRGGLHVVAVRHIDGNVKDSPAIRGAFDNV